jgi:hypothetical protein
VKIMSRRAKRDTYIYELKDSHRIVYYGITNNPDQRLISHDNGRKRFTHMNIIRGPMSRLRAEDLEYDYIQNYQYNHGGRPPRYNKLKGY